ncbi:MAG: DegV family protein [Clostridia bacterium]|nr:DegV family protein [Clostridia bacterium]MDD4685802.1 DegV family protein [Clostridia bacterium]
MKIVITADSTCDIPQNLVEKNNIHIIPIAIIMGDKEYLEGVNISRLDIYEFVDKNNILPKTSARGSYEYKEVFEKLKKEYDAIIHFSLSFNISCTGDNALQASKEFENVHVIDTKSLSSGSGLLVLSCADKIKNGLPLEQILEEIKQEVDEVQASFIISNLNYLKKGGRCSAIALLGANLLGIKIQIQLIDGKMQPTEKYIGKISACLEKYLSNLIKEYPPKLNRVFVTSSSAMHGIREKLVKQVKSLGFEEVIEMDAGATICCHCGPGTIGVLYMKK